MVALHNRFRNLLASGQVVGANGKFRTGQDINVIVSTVSMYSLKYSHSFNYELGLGQRTCGSCCIECSTMYNET